MRCMPARILALTVLIGLVGVFAGERSLAGPPSSGAAPSPLVQINAAKDQNGVQGYMLTAYIQADPKVVFEIVADTVHVDAIFHDVHSQLVKNEPTGNPAITKIVWHYTIDTAIGDKVLDMRVTEDHQNLTLQWERVSGDMKNFEGYGSVTACKEYPGWAKLEYNHFVDAGGMTPQFMVNRSNKNDLEDLVPNVEEILANAKGK